MEISEQVATVAGLRGRVAVLKDRVAELRTEWEHENKSLLGRLIEQSNALAQAEEALRAATVEAFEVSGRTNKTPAPGVGIRVSTKLEYDPAVALQWAHLHRLALKLDATAFEKIAAVDRPDFVVFRETISATIATDLGRFFPAPEAK